MTSQLVAHALSMAVWLRGPGATLLHYTDQGSQNTSESFQRLLAEHLVTCSMSRAGNVWDKSVMESFFSTPETERCDRHLYHKRSMVRADAFDYIERYFKPVRRHSTLGNVNLIVQEERMVAVA